MSKKGIDWNKLKKAGKSAGGALKGIGKEVGKGVDWYFGADLKKGGGKRKNADLMDGYPMDRVADEFFGFGSPRTSSSHKKKKKKDNIKVIVIRG